MDSERFQERETASAELKKIATKVVTLLEKAAADASLSREVQMRVKFVLDSLPQDSRRTASMPALLRHDAPLVSFASTQPVGKWPWAPAHKTRVPILPVARADDFRTSVVTDSPCKGW